MSGSPHDDRQETVAQLSALSASLQNTDATKPPSLPTAANDSAAAQFPGLEILEEIAPGVGGMGVVYKARELSLDRIVAVKTVRAHLRTPEGRDFFAKEARSAARLDHPNILRIHRFNPEHVP